MFDTWTRVIRIRRQKEKGRQFSILFDDLYRWNVRDWWAFCVWKKKTGGVKIRSFYKCFFFRRTLMHLVRGCLNQGWGGWVILKRKRISCQTRINEKTVFNNAAVRRYALEQVRWPKMLGSTKLKKKKISIFLWTCSMLWRKSIRIFRCQILRFVEQYYSSTKC